jgi:hypothetical protein
VFCGVSVSDAVVSIVIYDSKKNTTQRSFARAGGPAFAGGFDLPLLAWKCRAWDVRAEVRSGFDRRQGESESEAECLFQLSQEAYVRSTLPPEPDRARAERLCMEMISEYHKEK